MRFRPGLGAMNTNRLLSWVAFVEKHKKHKFPQIGQNTQKTIIFEFLLFFRRVCVLSLFPMGFDRGLPWVAHTRSLELGF